MVAVVDVHTHMLSDEWLALLERHGGPHYTLKEVKGGLRAIHLDGAPFMTPVPAMFDYDLRVKNMSKARVDALPGDVRDKVRGGNAQRIFGF